MNRDAQRIFDVVFVCTGNRARSALAEAFYHRHAAGLGTSARSFGTLDVGEAPALAHAIDAAKSLDADLSRHTAAVLPPGSLVDADLVIGFEPHHISAAVIDAKAPRERTFLMREIVELLDWWPEADGTAARARVAVSKADEIRRTRSRDLTPLVIADPLGKPPAVMYETAHTIEQLVRQLIRVLFGPLVEVGTRPPESRVQ